MPLSRNVFEARVRIDGRVRPDVRCLAAHRSIGGHRLDSAELSFELSPASNGFGGQGDILQNIDLSRGTVGQVCTVERRIGNRWETVHWGVISEARPHIGDSLEATKVSRLEPHHFGVPLNGIILRERTPSGSIKPFVIDAPLVFNPELDGKREPNMSGHRHALGFRPFLDPESSRSTRALAWRNESYAGAWTLAEAVIYLMGVCNPSQTFVGNFKGSPRDLEYYFNRQELYNVALPQGKFLPELLDMLLEPYGYSWYVEHHSNTRRQINFMRLADHASLPVYVGHQRPGERLDLSKTNAEEIDARYDVAKNLVNRVTVRGGYPEVEAAFELVRSWKEDHDTLNLTTDLALDADNFRSKPEYRDAWRKWVLNEAGDYCTLRPEIKKPFDFTSLFTDRRILLQASESPCAVRRRQFLPCLVTNDDGTPFGHFHGIRVQWHDTADWRDIPETEPVAVLTRECGIVFTGVFPPEYIYRLGSQARVRVVATVRADVRMSYTAVARQSVNPHAVPVEIQAHDRFNFRRVHTSSPHYAMLFPFERIPLQPNGEPAIPKPTTQQPFKSVEVDDRIKLKSLAEKLLERWNRADCYGPIVLTGTDQREIELGNSVPGVQGRGIRYNLAGTGTRAPIVLGIDYDFRQQLTTLSLDTVRQPEVI